MAIAPPLTLILLGVPAHFAVDRDRLRGEGLVDLHQVEIRRVQPAFVRHKLARRHRAHAHDLRIDAGRGIGPDARERRQAEFLRLLRPTS